MTLDQMRVERTMQELRAALQERYPPLASLRFRDRVRVRFQGEKRRVSQVRRTDVGIFSQDAVVVEWRGKDYFLRFGDIAS